MPKKAKKVSATPTPNLPPHHPEAVAHLADAMPWKTKVRFFEVEAYTEAICKLYDRGYSYDQIADWLNETLADKLGGKKIKRGQVYRVYQQWKELNNPFNSGLSVSHISDEDADKNAELSDNKPKESENNKNP